MLWCKSAGPGLPDRGAPWWLVQDFIALQALSLPKEKPFSSQPCPWSASRQDCPDTRLSQAHLHAVPRGHTPARALHLSSLSV